MRAGFGVTSDGDFNAREMDINAFALDVVAGDVQRVRPGDKRVVGAERLDAVITLCVIGREREIVRVKLDRLLVKRERLVENLLLR